MANALKEQHYADFYWGRIFRSQPQRGFPICDTEQNWAKYHSSLFDCQVILLANDLVHLELPLLCLRQIKEVNNVYKVKGVPYLVRLCNLSQIPWNDYIHIHPQQATLLASGTVLFASRHIFALTLVCSTLVWNSENDQLSRIHEEQYHWAANSISLSVSHTFTLLVSLSPYGRISQACPYA